jgi:ABC-type multidrug transport system fused ATPase/permease subunit
MAGVRDIIVENIKMMKILKYQVTITLIVFTLSSLTTYFEAIFMKRFIDSLAGLSAINEVIKLGTYLLSVIVLSYILSFYGEYLLQVLGLKSIKVLTSQVLESLYRARLQLIKTGDLLARIVSDLPELAHVVAGFIPALLINIINFIVVLFTLNVLSTQLLIVALILVPLNYFVYRIASRKISQYSNLERQSLSEMVNEVKTTIDSLFLIKRSMAFDYFRVRINVTLSQWISSLMKFIFYRIFFNKSYFYLNSILRIVILIIGGVLVVKGEISIGSLLAFSSILSSLYEPIMNIANFFTAISAYIPYLERYYEVININKESDGTKELKRVDDITIRNVTVKVDGKILLQNVNIKIKRGEVIGVKGPIGSGKTTLALLLTRFYEPATGEILINGVNYKEYTLASLRKKIYYVPSKDVILPVTLRENITLGNNISENELNQILKITRIDFASLDTKIDPNKLSEGQKQKVALARALALKPDVIILDEATNNLDRDDELKILKNIREHIPHVTLILISHRDSTLANTNTICIVNSGRVKCYKKH